jgi:hypothetical protein
MIATMAAAAPTHPDHGRAERGPLVRLALFAGLVAVVSALAALVGVALGDRVDSGSTTASPAHQGMSSAGSDASGLAVASGGEYLAEFGQTTLRRGEPARLSFRVLDADGAPVTDMDEHGGVRMHLLVVRRDLEGYQHLHPTLAADGSWQTDVTLTEAGVYRAFADFERGGEKVVLGTDLFVPGEFAPVPLPAPGTVASVDGYDVGLLADVHAGEEGELAFAIVRAGRAASLEPYLGARGHLVALREGDLAYLHVHPVDDGAPGEVSFEATFPTPGNYRLFLQFQEDGQVHTVPFTLEVAG